MKAIAVALVIGSILDACSLIVFMGMVPDGFQLAERNPIVLALLAIGGIQLLLLAKVGIAVFAAYRYAFSGWQPTTRLGRPLIRLLMPFTAIMMFVGFAFNSWAIIQVWSLM